MKELQIPPHDKDLEESILGVMLLEPRIVSQYISKLAVDFFYSPKHQVIFKSIQVLYDKMVAVDMVTIFNHLQQTGDIKYVGQVYDLVRMTNNVVSSAHMEDWVSILQNYYLQRQGIEIGQRLVNGSFKTTDIQNILNSASSEILSAQTNVFKNTERNIVHYLYNLAIERNRVATEGQIGLDTGWESLNHIISGWVAPDLIILAARPAQGKTAFMLNTIHNVLKRNIPVGVFSLEMSGEQLVNRVLSLVSGISHQKLRHAFLDDNEMKVVSQSEGRIEKFPLYIDDTPSLNIRELRSKATIMKRKHDIKLLCVDYLQLMSGVDRKGNRESEIAEISRGCKIIAKELGIPVIALSQLSRAVESRPDKMPQLSDLRESGGIEQDADSVIFLMRPETYNIMEVEIEGQTMPSTGCCVVKVAKNRHGTLKKIPMKFIGEQMKFEEYKFF